MTDKMDKIKELVRWELRKNNKMYEWNLHLMTVKKYADMLAVMHNPDAEVLELAVWLHDIGRIRYGDVNHHLSGAQDAEVILKDHNYPEETIGKVKECILSHRGESRDNSPQSTEARILATADAMYMMDMVPALFWEACHEKGLGVKEACDWVADEVERSWTKKILLPEGKEMVRDKYMAFRKIVETTRESLNGEKNVRLVN
jgi:uncharacterized protein